MKKKQYTARYFYSKFRSIPRHRWCVGAYKQGRTKFCAAGHCGRLEGKTTQECMALAGILFHNLGLYIANINDGIGPKKGMRDLTGAGKHPKTRILSALNYILILEKQKKTNDAVASSKES